MVLKVGKRTNETNAKFSSHMTVTSNGRHNRRTYHQGRSRHSSRQEGSTRGTSLQGSCIRRMIIMAIPLICLAELMIFVKWPDIQRYTDDGEGHRIDFPTNYYLGMRKMMMDSSPSTVNQQSILVYTTMDIDREEPCDIPCTYTNDYRRRLEANASVYELRGYQPPQEGDKFAIYLQMEGEHYYPIQLDGYQLENSYRWRSPLLKPYFEWIHYQGAYNISNPAVSWHDTIDGASFVARNCASRNNREQVVKDLRTLGIRVDGLSMCLHTDDHAAGTTDEKFEMLKPYKFTLAFENGNVVDYVTEKVYQALASGTLPVYMGAPNVHEYVPDNSIINFADFDFNVTLLSAHLTACMKNQSLYESYHAWRYRPLPEWFSRKFNFTWASTECRTCRYLHAMSNGLEWDKETQRGVIRPSNHEGTEWDALSAEKVNQAILADSVIPEPPARSLSKAVAASTTNKQSILVYSNMFFNRDEPCDIPCTYTSDENRRREADASVYELRGYQSPRAGDKFAIYLQMEGEHYYPIRLDGYQLENSYRWQSPLLKPYFEWIHYQGAYNISNPAVSWHDAIDGASFVARNCVAQNNREQVVMDLRTSGVRVDGLSACLHTEDHAAGTTDEKVEMLKPYKFTLAFENGNVVDYVTEKVYQALASGTLPVYMGAPNVHEYVPDNSIINFADFDFNATLLSAHLKACMKNQSLYESYHAWRYRPLPEWFSRKFNFTWASTECRTCRYLHAMSNGLEWDKETQRGIARTERTNQATLVHSIVTEPPVRSLSKAVTESTTNKQSILVYSNMFFNRDEPCDIPCTYTSDENLRLEADASVYERRGYQSPQQGDKFAIYLQMEGEHYYPIRLDGYQLENSYRWQSPLLKPYFEWIHYQGAYNISNPAVSWHDAIDGASFVARNCGAQNNREQVVMDLRTSGVRVDGLSACLHTEDHAAGTTDEKVEMLKPYKFTLAFENGNVVDYVTEKVYQALASGTLPVYMGAPNVHEYVPDNSIINFADFDFNVTLLSAHLKACMENQTLYESYHAWRYRPLPEWFSRKFNFTWASTECRTCRYLHAMSNGLEWDKETQRGIPRSS